MGAKFALRQSVDRVKVPIGLFLKAWVMLVTISCRDRKWSNTLTAFCLSF